VAGGTTAIELCAHIVLQDISLKATALFETHTTRVYRGGVKSSCYRLALVSLGGKTCVASYVTSDRAPNLGYLVQWKPFLAAGVCSTLFTASLKVFVNIVCMKPRRLAPFRP
jgi:hypothetical protein